MQQNILLVENSGSDFLISRINYAVFLVHEGFSVFVLIPDDGYREKIQREGITVYTYETVKSKSWAGMVWGTLKGYRNIFRQHKMDIVHSYRFFPNLLNVLANLFSKRKVVLHVTGLGIIYANHSFKFRLFRLLSNLVYFFMIRFSDVTIVQNPDDGRDLQFLGLTGNKIRLVKGSGVNTDLFNPEGVDRLSVRTKFGLASTDKVFICVTRVLWEKGIREMVAAFEKVAMKYPAAKLVIVGSPDNDNPRAVTQQYMDANNNRNNVFFWGRQNNIPAMLSAADVFLFPSYYREGVPRGVLEALAAGLPIITTDMPGCNLTVLDGVNGYLIKPRSVESIIDAVEACMTHTNVLPVMGQRSRELAETVFAEQVIYRQIREIYTIV